MQLDKAYAKLNLVQDFIPPGNSNRPGTLLAPTFITIHNTDNASPGANAAAHAKYQKGQDARDRKVSWHFTVDDKAVYQSLPTNEVGWHTGSGTGNHSSIGIEVCMHPGMDEKLAYEKAALLTALMARRLNIALPSRVVQHHHWSGKDCPRFPVRACREFLEILLCAVRSLPVPHRPASTVEASVVEALADVAPPILVEPRAMGRSEGSYPSWT